MFLAPDGKTYEPHKIKSRPKAVAQEDTEMGGTEGEAEEIYEDVDDLEGAVYPLKGMNSAQAARDFAEDDAEDARWPYCRYAGFFCAPAPHSQHALADSPYAHHAAGAAVLDGEKPRRHYTVHL